MYVDIVEAYNSGGNVSIPVSMLNKAILDLYIYNSTLDPKFLEDANKTLDDIGAMLPRLAEEGRNRVFWNNVFTASTIITIVVAAILAYIYLPKLYFNTWRRIRKNYRVIPRRSRAGRKSMIISEEVWAVILAIVVVGSVFAVSQAYLSNRVVEPFSELALLGENMKIGDYPTNLVAGDNATFYVYVGNHMGRPMYYLVGVKLGDNSTPINPAPIKPVMTFERVLLNNETWIFRVDLPIESPGINKRIIVELWIYNESINALQYHERWTQLWINVTEA